MVTIASKMTMAIEMGTTIPKAMVPAAARITSISCVAYAVDERASDANTASPTPFPMVWWDASAVDKGRPMNQERKVRGGFESIFRSMIAVSLCLIIIFQLLFFYRSLKQAVPAPDHPEFNRDGDQQ